MARFRRNSLKEKALIELYDQGFRISKICERMGVSRSYYQNVAAALRKEGKLGYRLNDNQRKTVQEALASRRASMMLARSTSPEPTPSVHKSVEPSIPRPFEFGVEHRLRLRKDFDLVIKVPEDLTHEEVDRIGYWFRAIVQ